MSKKELSEKEKKFIIALFDLEPSEYATEKKRLKAAKELAGYSPAVSPYALTKKLKEEIIIAAQEYAALNIPRGIKMLASVIDGSERGIAIKDAIRCVELLAGYGGLLKQDKQPEANTAPTQVLVMPEKSINKIRPVPTLITKDL